MWTKGVIQMWIVFRQASGQVEELERVSASRCEAVFLYARRKYGVNGVATIGVARALPDAERHRLLTAPGGLSRAEFLARYKLQQDATCRSYKTRKGGQSCSM